MRFGCWKNRCKFKQLLCGQIFDDLQEFDTPERLYNKSDGIFRGMCDRSSITVDDIKNVSKAREEYIDSNVSACGCV